ncbi:MAG TPA: flippase [Lacipirellulaceae bacterium]|jgi:O-antigen/teichoic acid export membrane protein|nr:flippase [Lacipirellulaceae bacterium]
MSDPLQVDAALAVDGAAAPIHLSEISLTKIVRNSGFNAIGTMLIVPFNFVAMFLLARRLGAEALGTFFTIFAICAVIHWIADAGTTTVMTRRVARFPHELNTIVAEAIGVLIVVCLISVVLFMVVAVPWMKFATEEQISLTTLSVAAAAMAARHSLEFGCNLFRGLERFEFENIARVVQTGLFLLFVWAGVHPETGGTIAAFTAYAASNLLAAALLWAILFKGWKCAGFCFRWHIIRHWWRESLPLGFGDVVRQVQMQLDTLLLSAFRPAAVVGLFSIACRPLQPLQLLPRIIVSVTFPMLSRSARSNREAFSRTFAQTTNLLWIASLPISIIVTASARPMIIATAGPEFADAALPLQLLIWTTGLVFVNAQHRFVLTALDAEQKYWRLIIWSLGIKVALEIGLIALWGVYGACLGNLVGEAILCIWALKMLHQMGIQSPGHGQVLRAVPGAIAMAFFLWPFASYQVQLGHPIQQLFILGLGSAVSTIVFIAVCLLCGAWRKSDLMRVCQAFRRPERSSANLPLAATPEVAEGALG